MDTQQEPVPKEFFDLIDRFVGLANELTCDHATSRVSSVIMYAAARYNAHCMLAIDPDSVQNRQAATDYFVAQYRSMLEENIDALIHSIMTTMPNDKPLTDRHEPHNFNLNHDTLTRRQG